MAVVEDDPLRVNAVCEFVNEWAFSAAVIADFGGVDELQRAREEASKHAVPLDEALQRLASA